MTFKQILDDAAERLGNTSAEARVRYRRFLNEWYRRVLSDVNLPRGGASTITLVDGTAEYSLPATIGRVRSIRQEAHGTNLVERSLTWIREADPEETCEGIPQFYAYVTDRLIRLHPIPNAAGTLDLDGDLVVTEMDDDADVPIIPEDFHYILTDGVCLNEARRLKDMESVRDLQQAIGGGVSALRYWIASRRANVRNPAEGYGVKGSRLGSWYPRGT